MALNNYKVIGSIVLLLCLIGYIMCIYVLFPAVCDALLGLLACTGAGTSGGVGTGPNTGDHYRSSGSRRCRRYLVTDMTQLQLQLSDYPLIMFSFLRQRVWKIGKGISNR